MRNISRTVILLACLILPSLSACADNIAVTTYHFNNQRTGWNSHETILSPANVSVSSFGKLWHTTLDGDVAGSPLYVPGVQIGDKLIDVIYAATNSNSVYALDANSGSILWGPVRVAPPVNDVAFQGSGDLKHPNGILSTPVIDLKSHAIYVCALFQPKIQQQFGVWALDLSTGKIKPNWPVIIHGSYLGCEFNGGQVLQRGALLLNDDGWVYIPFGARADRPDWHGWLVGINTQNPNAPIRLWSPDPHAEGGGIWGVGGPSTDTNGNIFVVMGNGGNNYGEHSKIHGVDIGQSVERITSTRNGLVPHYDDTDLFMPRNVEYLNDTDEDLGGGGGVILPTLTLSNGSLTKKYDLLTTGGKEGVAYLLDQHNLGGVGHSLFEHLYFGDPKVQDLGEIRAVCCYFDSGVQGQYLYYPGEDQGPDGELGLVCLKLGLGTNGKPNLTRIWTLASNLQRPTSPIVTSDGDTNGIVWEVEPDLSTEGGFGPGVLHAYDAFTGKELYNSSQNATRDSLVHSRKFAGAIVSNGHLFAGVDGVVCYGELPSQVDGVSGK